MKNQVVRVWARWNANLNLIVGLVLLFWGVYAEIIMWSLLKSYQPVSDIDAVLPELVAPLANIGMSLLCLAASLLCFFGTHAEDDAEPARPGGVIGQILATLLWIGVAAAALRAAWV